MPDDLPLSVWPTAGGLATGVYVPESQAHRNGMLPAVARHAIRAYTSRHDIVLDPACGVGATVVEAMRLGREGWGLTEERWHSIAQANVALASGAGATGRGWITTGDWQPADASLTMRGKGRVRLVLTCPPPAVWRAGLVSGLLGAAASFLADGGFVVVCTRPWRAGRRVLDAPNAVSRVAEDCGLTVIERNVALLTGVSGNELTGIRAPKTSRAGRRLHVLAHQDVVVLRKL